MLRPGGHGEAASKASRLHFATLFTRRPRSRHSQPRPLLPAAQFPSGLSRSPAPPRAWPTIKHIHTVLRPPSPSTPEPFHRLRLDLCPHEKRTPHPALPPHPPLHSRSLRLCLLQGPRMTEITQYRPSRDQWGTRPTGGVRESGGFLGPPLPAATRRQCQRENSE